MLEKSRWRTTKNACCDPMLVSTSGRNDLAGSARRAPFVEDYSHIERQPRDAPEFTVTEGAPRWGRGIACFRPARRAR